MKTSIEFKKVSKTQGIKLVKDFFTSKSIIFKELKSKEKKPYHIHDLVANISSKTEPVVIKDRSSMIDKFDTLVSEGFILEKGEYNKMSAYNCHFLINTFISKNDKFFIIFNLENQDKNFIKKDLPTTTLYKNNEIIEKEVMLLSIDNAIIVKLDKGNFTVKKLASLN